MKERANMTEVVMKKDELLKALVKNKAKHDALLAVATETYWKVAKAKVEEIEKSFYGKLAQFGEEVQMRFDEAKQRVKQRELPTFINISSLPQPNTALNLVYPEDHSKDYDRAIAMVKATVYKEVKLTLNEFDNFVLNDWTWKAAFVNALKPFREYAENDVINMFQFSGCAPQYTGIYSLDYRTTSNAVLANFGSGLASF